MGDKSALKVRERIGSSQYYYLFDGLGSVMAVTGSAGTSLDTYSYDPYGTVTPGGMNSVANPWQYTGGYLDSQTGLVKEGQRFYDPSLGRWTQQDPLPLGNRYVYASDNPINFIDPRGLDDFGSGGGGGGDNSSSSNAGTVAASAFTIGATGEAIDLGGEAIVTGAELLTAGEIVAGVAGVATGGVVIVGAVIAAGIVLHGLGVF